MNSDKFSIEEKLSNQTRTILLKGVIDEDTDFSEIHKFEGPLHLNLSGITSINSLGIRAWVNFWKTVTDKAVIYVECPPVIVRQLNMIPSFSGRATVSSVFVPFICDECEAEDLKLVDCSSPQWQVKDVPESYPCDQCVGGEKEADGGLKQYFAFRK